MISLLVFVNSNLVIGYYHQYLKTLNDFAPSLRQLKFGNRLLSSILKNSQRSNY